MWTNEMLEVLRKRYRIDGAEKLAKRFGKTPTAVSLKASRIGITPKTSHDPYVWTGEMLEKMNTLFATSDRETLEKEIGLPIHAIRSQARRMGLINRMANVFSAKSKSENCKSCNIHFFDEWNADMAYILGFLFADGNVSSRLTEITIGINSKDKEILHFIKEKMESKRPFYEVGAGQYQNGANPATYLVLGGKILVQKAIELGMKPRKTFNDDPFPDVPDNVFPHFVRGYFDGDGSASISAQNICNVGFVGSVKFITGIRDGLIRLANMKANPVKKEQHKIAVCGRVGWSAIEDLKKFYSFIYPEGFGFCLERKRQRLFNWLKSKTKGE